MADELEIPKRLRSQKRGDLFHQPNGDTVEPIVVTSDPETHWNVAIDTLRPFVFIEEAGQYTLIQGSLAPVCCQLTTPAWEALVEIHWDISEYTRESKKRPNLSDNPNIPSSDRPFEAFLLKIPAGYTESISRKVVKILRDVDNWGRYTSPIVGVEAPAYPDLIPAEFPHPESPSVQTDTDSTEQTIPVETIPDDLSPITHHFKDELLGDETKAKPDTSKLNDQSVCPNCGTGGKELSTEHGIFECPSDEETCRVKTYKHETDHS